MNPIWKHTVKLTEPKTTIYHYATGRFEDLPSRKSVKKAIKKGLLRLNDEIVESSRHLHNGDVLSLLAPENSETRSFDLSFEIIYEDEDLAIINKPAGYPVSGRYLKTIQNALQHNIRPSQLSDRIPPHAVHRLDKATRGVLLIAKTRLAQIELGRQFEIRSIRKSYHVLCMGKAPIAGNIHLAIDDLVASTSWQRIDLVQDKFSEYLSLVQLFPKTGRRHQLRKHMASIGHAILGDPRYSPPGKQLMKKGLFLAATGIAFKHPRSEEALCFHLPIPHKFSYRMQYAESRVCDHLRE